LVPDGLAIGACGHEALRHLAHVAAGCNRCSKTQGARIFKEEEETMEGNTAASRTWIDIARLWIVVGLVLLAGCTTVEEGLPAWMRPWQAPHEAAARQDSAPLAPVDESRGQDTLRRSYPPLQATVAPAGRSFAAPTAPSCSQQTVFAPAVPTDGVPSIDGVWAAPPQSVGPPVRLMSGESTAPAMQSDPAQSPNSRPEVARQQARFVGQPITTTVLHVDSVSFEEQVLKSRVPVLVDFYASWCGPCKRLAPTLEELAAENPTVQVVKVDVDDSPELAERYGIHSMPSLLVFKNGRIVASTGGIVSKSRLEAMLGL
jgi:thioredoxin 1